MDKHGSAKERSGRAGVQEGRATARHIEGMQRGRELGSSGIEGKAKIRLPSGWSRSLWPWRTSSQNTAATEGMTEFPALGFRLLLLEFGDGS